tara:strand:+ start:1233 stop:2138 length:906 start_codon:yes stop_codon:yes gene_type:complete
MNVEHLGFIGIGQMGLPMARNLMKAGHRVTVFDVNKNALDKLQVEGANVVTSPKAVADGCDVVMVSLPTPDVVKSVATGEQGVVHGNQVRAYVDLSTTGSTVAAEVADVLGAADVQVLDCPVSGGERGAIAGTLTLMVAGDAQLFEQLKQPLASIGDEHFYVGEKVGLAQTLKLCNNFLSAANNVAAAEAMVTAVKGGLDPHVALNVINASSGRNSATDGKFEELVLTRQFNKSMKTRLLHKDLSLFTEEAQALGVPTWVGANVKQLLAYSLTQGMGDEASVSLIKNWEQWAGVEVGAEGD